MGLQPDHRFVFHTKTKNYEQTRPTAMSRLAAAQMLATAQFESYVSGVTSLQEIEQAISSLSADDRAKLIASLPKLLPEWDGDMAWDRIHQDPTPSASLSALVDDIDSQFRSHPEGFPEIQKSDFERRA